MKLAHLVNQYPKTSHSFIRREIHALEASGVEVHRYSVRPVSGELPDPRDRAEIPRTRILLEGGVSGLARAFVSRAVRRPGGVLRSALSALRLGVGSERGVLRHVAYLAEACVLADELERDGVEHVHAHFGTNSAAVAMLCRELGGPPYSFTVHGPDEFDRAPLLGLDQKTAGAAFVVAISSFGRSQLCRLNKLGDWEKIHVVRCGLDEVLLDREPTPVPEARRVVCVARLSEQKGHLMLLEAAARLVHEGEKFELVLAGDGELRALVDQRIRDLGLEQTVRITGWISERQVAGEIEASRALVLPSLAEGLPVVLMEALALGRPVLSTYIAGIPELVVPGENGWLVPAGDVSAVTSALREILNAPPLRLTEMGRAGRRAVVERHDVRKTSALLRSLIEGAGGRTSSRPADAQTMQR